MSHEFALIYQVGIIPVNYSAVWSNSAIRLGHLVNNIWPSGFYLFGCSDLTLWTSPTSNFVDFGKNFSYIVLYLATLIVELTLALASQNKQTHRNKPKKNKAKKTVKIVFVYGKFPSEMSSAIDNTILGQLVLSLEVTVKVLMHLRQLSGH